MKNENFSRLSARLPETTDISYGLKLNEKYQSATFQRV